MEVREEKKEVFETNSVYLPYIPRFKDAISNSNIMEAASLAHTNLPVCKYDLKMPKDIYMTGKLNASQIDAVMYCCERHNKISENKEREGFFLGDSAGLGKGRVISGIILENIMHGRNRSIWITQSSDLFIDCFRDFENVSPLLTGYAIEARLSLNSYPDKDGTYFVTYSSLSSKNIQRRNKIVEWFSKCPDGVIILDECHKAKGAEDTAIGIMVKDLQKKLPDSRIVYSSATAFYSPSEMSYMTRLGIWDGPPFSNFKNFEVEMTTRGISAMELLACELKSEGKYLSRQMSMVNVEAEFLPISKNDEFDAIYDKSTQLWMLMYNNLFGAKKKQYSAFWANHLNFFSTMIVSSKITQCSEIAIEAVTNHNFVAVFGVQRTGDSRFLDMIKDLEIYEGKFSLAEAIIINTLKCVFNYDVKNLGEIGLNTSMNSGNTQSILFKVPEEIETLFMEIRSKLPQNPLNDLISKLGGNENVAEMTGRRIRPTELDGEVFIDKNQQNNEKISNISERNLFQSGVKKYGIISDAASTGFSLHSCSDTSTPMRRLHITLEYPWAADKLIQQLGRTHRFNQRNAPKYLFPVSSIPGEERFRTTIAQRLELMGAITQGDRRASKKDFITESCVDSELGNKAMNIFLKCLTSSISNLIFSKNIDISQKNIICDNLSNLGVLSKSSDSNYTLKRAIDLQKFFNRVLGLPLSIQKTIIDTFYLILEDLVRESLIQKSYNLGVLDYKVNENAITELIETSDITVYNKQVSIHLIQVDFGLSWESLSEKSKNLNNKRFLIIKNSKTQIFFLFTENNDTFVLQPNDGRKVHFRLFNEYHKVFPAFNKKRLNFSDEEAEEIWKKQYYSMSNSLCVHDFMNLNCGIKECEFGSRMKMLYVVSGHVNSIWNKITSTIETENLNIVRITTFCGQKIIGVLISYSHGLVLLNKLQDRWIE